jgi:hypothetical protein
MLRLSIVSLDATNVEDATNDERKSKPAVREVTFFAVVEQS